MLFINEKQTFSERGTLGCHYEQFCVLCVVDLFIILVISRGHIRVSLLEVSTFATSHYLAMPAKVVLPCYHRAYLVCCCYNNNNNFKICLFQYPYRFHFPS